MASALLDYYLRAPITKERLTVDQLEYILQRRKVLGSEELLWAFNREFGKRYSSQRLAQLFEQGIELYNIKHQWLKERLRTKMPTEADKRDATLMRRFAQMRNEDDENFPSDTCAVAAAIGSGDIHGGCAGLEQEQQQPPQPHDIVPDTAPVIEPLVFEPFKQQVDELLQMDNSDFGLTGDDRMTPPTGCITRVEELSDQEPADLLHTNHPSPGPGGVNQTTRIADGGLEGSSMSADGFWIPNGTLAPPWEKKQTNGQEQDKIDSDIWFPGQDLEPGDWQPAAWDPDFSHPSAWLPPMVSTPDRWQSPGPTDDRYRGVTFKRPQTPRPADKPTSATMRPRCSRV